MITDLADVLAWVLIHSLWQGLVIAGIVLVLLRTIPARLANTRYLTALTGLLGIVLAMLATGSVLSLGRNRLAEPGDKIVAAPADSQTPSTEPRDSASHGTPHASPASDGNANIPLASAPKHWSHRWANWLLMGWLLGVGVMILRTAAAIVQVRSWRQSVLPMNPESLTQLEVLLQELYGRLGFRRAVSLVISDRVSVPSIIGTLWPCILVPSAMLTGIPPDQWRIILAHELAHIRRYDVLVNLVQMLIESVLFFNPAMWWLSHQIRVEREACCDALAAKVCGESLTVARTLVEFAASLDTTRASEEIQRTRVSPSVLASFADPAEPGTLTDRVHRLVQPDAAAHPKVSWWGLLVVMGSLGLTSLGLGWGTDAVVKTAAQLMSPKQRVAELERLQNEATGQYFPAEPKPSSTPALGETKAVPEVPASGVPKFSVTVIVRTPDGSPVPREMYLMSHSRLGNYNATSTIGGNDRGQSVFRETYQFGPGFLRIGLRCPGYAEAGSAILDLRSGDKSRTVEFVLDRGSTVKLSIRDETGIPIPNALFGATANLGFDGGGGGWPRDNVRTDEQGLITLTNVGSLGYTVRIRARGFQTVELKESHPVEAATLSLIRAAPVQFTVVDGESDRPLAGARFRLLSKSRKGSTHSYGENPRDDKFYESWREYGVTDPSGALVIDELQSETQHVFGVRVPDFGIAVVQRVQAGDPARTIKIYPPVKLTGRITGNLDQLPRYRPNPAAKPQRILKYGSSLWEGSLDSSKHAIIDEKGRFEIVDRIIDEKMTFALPNREETIVVSKSPTELHWDIGPVGAPETVREVIVRLTGTAPEAPARGTVSIWGRHPDPKVRLDAGGDHLVEENEVKIKVPVGMRLSIRPQRLIGYQFNNSDVKIDAGQGPQVIEIPARPAGGILSTIVRSDGTPAADGIVTVVATQLPPDIKKEMDLNPIAHDRAFEILSSLPLGGRYRILAREFNQDRIAWAVSPEILLDQSQPIAKVRLQLLEGRPSQVCVLTPDGQPARGIPVVMKVSFWPNARTSHENSAVRTTDERGIAVFQNVSSDTTLPGMKVKLAVSIPPTRYCGWRGEIDLRNPLEVRLTAGLTASGVLIEASSGKPIPNASLRLVPQDFGQAKYFGGPEVTTDRMGRFQFEGMEPIEYRAYHVGLVAAETNSVVNPQDRVQRDRPEDKKQLTIRGGDQSITWKATIAPGSSLKVAD